MVQASKDRWSMLRMEEAIFSEKEEDRQTVVRSISWGRQHDVQRNENKGG